MKHKITWLIVAVMLCMVGGFLIECYSLLNNNTKSIYADATYSEVQSRLKQWGYYNGPITGELDNATVEAIKYFQRKHGIAESGKLDVPTANALGVTVNNQSSNDLYLLAKCVYAEARGESYVGQVAVAAVILNRVASPDFPNTIYGVIYQPWAFTAVHDGQINLEPDYQAYQAAQDAMNGWDPTYGAIYYYNPAVATSQWIYSRKIVTTIGDHVFAV